MNSVKKLKYYSSMSDDPKIIHYYFNELGHIQNILDIGCGYGALGKFKPNRAIEVYGLDIDENAIKHAQQYEHADVIDLNSCTLPYPDKFFDAVLARDVLEHLDKPWLVLNEVDRVLKPGGIVIASVPMAKPKVVWNDYTHIRGFTSFSLQMLFEDIGFDIISIKKFGGIPLASKLNYIKYIPLILNIPLLEYFYGKSFEIKAQKPK